MFDVDRDIGLLIFDIANFALLEKDWMCTVKNLSIRIDCELYFSSLCLISLNSDSTADELAFILPNPNLDIITPEYNGKYGNKYLIFCTIAGQ